MHNQLRAGPVARSRPFVPHGILAFGIGMFIFYAAALSAFHRVIVPLLILFYLSWTALSSEHRPGARVNRTKYWLVGLYLLLAIVLGRLIGSASGTEAAITFQRLFVLYPLVAATGWLLVRTGRLRQYYSWFLAIGLATLPAAYYEYLANTTLLNNHSYARNGQSRAVVGADQPLVLGTLFLGLIPIALYVLPRWRRSACVLLFLGVVATGSNGPMLVGAALLIVCLVPALMRVVVASAKPLYGLLLAVTAFLAFGSAYLWTNQITGATTTQVSNEYRGALYWLLPRMLFAHPAGFGLGGLPAGTYLFSGYVSGIIDVKQSIDSEVVYAAGEFGILAVTGFAIVCWISVRGATRQAAIGLSTLAVTLAGFFLALHSWESMGSFWFLGIGACAAAATAPRPVPPVQADGGLSGTRSEKFPTPDRPVRFSFGSATSFPSRGAK